MQRKPSSSEVNLLRKVDGRSGQAPFVNGADRSQSATEFPPAEGVTTTIGGRGRIDSGTTTHGRGARFRASAVTSHGRCHGLGDQHAKLRDVVGVYIDPPAHAVVLLVDENSQIHAWDRTQPGLPMKRGRAGTPRATVRPIEPQRASRPLHRSVHPSRSCNTARPAMRRSRNAASASPA
jgi:hypothetical protein